jgi:DNA-binding NarL/FixJ family response regulator
VIKELTHRQKEFLVLSAVGMTYNQIAEKCVVEPSTVKNTFAEARKRLETSTTTQCLLLAIAREEIGITHDGIAFLPVIDNET